MMGSRLPIGMQSFEKLRDGDNVYIDKTGYINKLVHRNGEAYFLSRPRRFGKSLFLSTLKAYWEGKRELFKGLILERLEAFEPEAWEPHPVLYFDFNGENYQPEGALESAIARHLARWEETYGCEAGDLALSARFQNLLVRIREVTGRRAVILVDEYDKPLLENGGGRERMEHDKAVFRGFFSTLKSYDEYIRFTLITGVTKFSKVSLFTDLNHLTDISIDERFAAVCGVTERELASSLSGQIAGMAKKNGMSKEDCAAALARMYGGYRFCQGGEVVCNPFSLMRALAKGSLGTYWSETGMLPFLAGRIAQVRYDIRKITDGKVYAGEAQLLDYRDEDPDPVPLLYQSGCLTLSDYDPKRGRYTLRYPNEDVKYGFLEAFAPYCLTGEAGSAPDIFALDDALETGDTEGAREALAELLGRLPKGEDARDTERIFQTAVYLIFTLLGRFVRVQIRYPIGRIIAIIETEKLVYLVEIARKGFAEEALMRLRKAAEVYGADSRRIIRLGIVCRPGEPGIAEWGAEEQ